MLTNIEQPKLCQFTFCKCMFEFSRHFISSKRGRSSLIASTHGIVVNQPRSTSVWLQKLLSLLLQSNSAMTNLRQIEIKEARGMYVATQWRAAFFLRPGGFSSDRRRPRKREKSGFPRKKGAIPARKLTCLLELVRRHLFWDYGLFMVKSKI